MRRALGTMFWLGALGAVLFVALRLQPGGQLRFWLLFPTVVSVCGLIGVWVHERGRP